MLKLDFIPYPEVQNEYFVLTDGRNGYEYENEEDLLKAMEFDFPDIEITAGNRALHRLRTTASERGNRLTIMAKIILTDILKQGIELPPLEIPHQVFIDEGIEPGTFKPNHYHSQPFNASLVQETIYSNILATDPHETGTQKAAMWVSFALKHLIRAGLKDDWKLEIKKAEDYLHKARTGEWLSEKEQK